MTLQVSFSPKLPVDPEKIQTMSDYDVALCLYRTWFEYDTSRQAIPGLVSKWKFDHAAGAYHFTIDNESKWSDGSALTSDQLIKNLERLVKIQSSYGASVAAIIDIKNAKVLDQKNFILPTVSKQPSEAFFQRMGSIFLAVTHPSDWDKNGALVSNRITIGPYKVSEVTKDELNLTAHEFDKLADKRRPSKIRVLLSAKKPTIEEFANGKSTDSIIQANTMMSKETYQKIIAQKLPYWTRAYDRVSYINPIKPFEKNSEKLRNFVKLLGKKFYEQKNKIDLPENVKVAQSLQPKGYPLNDQLKYTLNSSEEKNLPKEVSILTTEGFQYQFQRTIIDRLAQEMNPAVKVNWVVKPTMGAFLDELTLTSPHDLSLSSFGVADPEAATWLSLVLNKESPFVELSALDTKNFEGILNKHSGHDTEVLELKKLLTAIGERGSYLALFHFSTMSVAKPGISFENIKELDETVDYSKLIIK